MLPKQQWHASSSTPITLVGLVWSGLLLDADSRTVRHVGLWPSVLSHALCAYAVGRSFLLHAGEIASSVLHRRFADLYSAILA